MTKEEPGLSRPKKKQTNRAGKSTLTRPSEAVADPEPSHRTTLNIPYSIYKEMREVWRDQGTPMSEQLLNAWREQKGWKK